MTFIQKPIFYIKMSCSSNTSTTSSPCRPTPLSPILLSIPRPNNYQTPMSGSRRIKIEGSMYSESMLSRTIIFDLPQYKEFKWCKHSSNCIYGTNCKFAHIRDRYTNNPLDIPSITEIRHQSMRYTISP